MEDFMENNLVKVNNNLPANLDDLNKFILIGKEKLISVKAEIRAMKNLKVAEDVYKQKEVEARELGGALLLAKTRIGELTKVIPKGNKHQKDTAVLLKKDELHKMGISEKDKQRFEQLANNKDIVEYVIKNSEDIPTQTECLKKIQEKKNPHIVQNSGDNEWYTPIEYIESSRKVMGSIDLDPATSVTANEIVQAKNIYTINENGLINEWYGNIFLNPPYSVDLINKFIDKLIEELKNINQCILLVNNATDTIWFQKIVHFCSGICFPKGRIKFYKPNSNKCSPLQGQCFLYFGINIKQFYSEFSKIGCVFYNER
jgi:hypothetical protein